MAHDAKISLVVIWSDELKAAAQLLAQARDAEDPDESDRLAAQAYRACEVALRGVEAEHAVPVIGDGAIREAATRYLAARAAQREGGG
jgi:hypothetical protein